MLGTNCLPAYNASCQTGKGPVQVPKGCTMSDTKIALTVNNVYAYMLKCIDAGEPITDPRAIAKFRHIVEQSAKRSTTAKAATPKQRVNAEIKDVILAFLHTCETAYMSDVVKCDARITSSQHATSLINQLVRDGKVERVKVGKDTTYRATN